MTKRPITEDDLQGFIDNALGPERHQEVEEYLGAHGDAAAQVAAYRKQASALRSALDPIAAEPIPSRLNLSNIASKQRSVQGPRFGRMAAAAMVLLAVGAAGGWLMKGYSSPPTEGVEVLAQEASASFRTFSPDKQRPVEVRADGSDALQQFVSTTLGSPAVIPDLSKSGYRLMGGRVVPTMHGSGFMLMYDNDKGSRLVMLSRRMLKDQDRPMVGNASGKANSWSWARDGMGYSLVGDLPAEELHPIADAVRSQV